MTRTQAERKAMELYPVKMQPGFKKRMVDTNARLRAAFMQCFDLMTTGSLPMTREECKEWLNERFQHWSKDYLNCGKYMVLAMYDHLAFLSSAAQPATGYTEERGHSTNPNVQEKASIQPPLSAPEWINKHNSGG